MEHLLVIIPTAAVVFATTNIDDLLVLTLLFMASRADGGPRPWQVVAGQTAGIAVLIASAGVAAVGLVIVPTRWIGLLGLFPVGLGLWRLIGAIRRPPDNDTPASVTAGLTGVAAVAIVNGADNITIYTPMFRSLPASGILVTLAVFVAMIGIWSAAAAWLGAHMAAVAAIRRLSHRLVPIVLIAIGLIFLIQSAVG